MPKVLSFLLTILLFILPSICNAEGETEHKPINGLHPGSGALMFNVNNGFTLGEWSSMAIGTKHHFTDDKAIRVGLNFGWTGDDEDHRTEQVIPSNDYSASSSSNRSQFTWEFRTEYVKYNDTHTMVNLYYLGGVITGYSNFDSESKDSDGDRSTSHEDEWTYGAVVGLGAEWFASPNISFTAEYNFSMRYIDTEEQMESISVSRGSISKTTLNRSGWSLNMTSAQLGLSLYF